MDAEKEGSLTHPCVRAGLPASLCLVFLGSLPPSKSPSMKIILSLHLPSGYSASPTRLSRLPIKCLPFTSLYLDIVQSPYLCSLCPS